MKCGLAVTTCMRKGLDVPGRTRVFRRCVESLMASRFRGPILFIDDCSDVTSHLGLLDTSRSVVIGNRRPKGIAASKNIGLRLLYDLGCDCMMLSDDDVEFLDPGFAEGYLHSHAESGVHMLCANFSCPRRRVSVRGHALDEVGDHNGHFISLTRHLVDAMGYFKVLPHAYGGEHSEYQRRAVQYHPQLCGGCYDVVDSARLVKHQDMPPAASHRALARTEDVLRNLQMAACDSPHVAYAERWIEHCPPPAAAPGPVLMNGAAQHVDTPAVLRELLRPLNLSRIVELGTAGGGLTNLLAEFAPEVYTFDKTPPPPLAHNVIGHTLDLHSDGCIPCIARLLDHPGTLLVCDDGDKPWECRTFSPFLRPRAPVLVHDYGPVASWPWCEFTDADVPAWIENASTEESRRVAWFLGRRR